MAWEKMLYVGPLLLSAAASALLGAFLWRRRHVPAATPAALFMLAVVWWSLTYALELATPELPGKLFWLKLEYPAIALSPLPWLAMALEYTGQRDWLTRRRLAFLLAVPAVTVALVWTTPAHTLYYRQIALSRAGPVTQLVLEQGPWYRVNATYAYLLLLAGSLMLISFLARAPRMYRQQSIVLLLGTAAPWLVSILYVFRWFPLPNLDPTPMAFTLTGAALAWNIARFRLLDIVPVARQRVFESIGDGLMVLDAAGRVVDLNPVAERILQVDSNQAIGRPAHQILDGCPALLDLVRRHEGPSPVEITVGQGKDRRHYDLSITRLRTHQEHEAGRLVLFRDVTARKEAEEALRRSEERFRALFEFAPDAYYLNDLNGVFVAGNRAAEEMLGYRREELIGRTFLQAGILPVAEIRKAVELLARNRRGEATGPDELVLKRKDEGLVPVEIRTYPVTIGDQKLVLGIARDITQRKAMEEALRHSEQQYRNLVESQAEGVTINDPEGRFTFANPAAHQILGVAPGDLVGRVFSEFTDEEQEAAFRIQLARRRRGEKSTYEAEIVRPDGERRTLAITAMPHRDAEGQFTGSFVVFRDVTEQRRVEQERERLIEELQRALAQVKTLSGLLPICASCKRIRDDQGYWSEVEQYLEAHSAAEFTHSLCPDCLERLYPKLYPSEGEENKEP